MIPEDWTYDEFLTFVMIYASYADEEIYEEQKELITDRVSEEKYNILLNYFLKNTDAINISLINEMKGEYLKSEDEVKTLLNTVFDTIRSNGFVNKQEKEMYDNLKFILEM